MFVVRGRRAVFLCAGLCVVFYWSFFSLFLNQINNVFFTEYVVNGLKIKKNETILRWTAIRRYTRFIIITVGDPIAFGSYTAVVVLVILLYSTRRLSMTFIKNRGLLFITKISLDIETDVFFNIINHASRRMKTFISVILEFYFKNFIYFFFFEIEHPKRASVRYFLFIF